MHPFPEHALTVLVAFSLGALIGAEREWRRHPGGLRSCALVAAAAWRIGVAVHRLHGRDERELVEDVVATHVARMEDQLDARERAVERLAARRHEEAEAILSAAARV